MTVSKRPAGIALIDLVVAVLITGIIAAITMPRFSTAYRSWQTEAAARLVESDLNYLRRQAITSSTTAAVVFNEETQTYTCEQASSLDGTTGSFQRDLQSWIGSVNIAVKFDDWSAIQFDLNGRPLNRSGSSLSSGVIEIRGGSHVWQVAVDPVLGKAIAQRVP